MGKKSATKKTTVKDFFYIILFVFFVLYSWRERLIFYPVLNNFPTRQIKAIVVDDSKYIIPNQRVFIKGKRHYYYSFYFLLKGEKYYGDTGSLVLHPKDTILVEYNELFPFMNRMVE